MFKCIIIDDQVHAAEALGEFVNAVPELKLISIYNDPMIALREIYSSQDVDLILMDIDMPGMSGIELASFVRQRTKKLVFVTAHSSYAYQAFKVNADEFLLKPYSINEFTGIIDKLFGETEKSKLTEDLKTFFFVKSKEEQNRIVKIDFKEVIALESKLNYVVIHTFDKKVTTLIPLSEISKFFFTRGGFVKFQRSFIIALDHIKSIDGMAIYMKGNVNLTVGEFYRKDFRAFLEKNIINKSGARIS